MVAVPPWRDVSVWVVQLPWRRGGGTGHLCSRADGNSEQPQTKSFEGNATEHFFEQRGSGRTGVGGGKSSMIHMHSTFHVDLMRAPATYRFTDSQAVSLPGQGQAVEPLGGGRRGGDGKRSNRCVEGGGRRAWGGMASGGAAAAWEKGERGPGAWGAVSRSTPRTRSCAGHCVKLCPRGHPDEKKGKGSGRGEEGGGTQAKSMRARVSTYNCACMRVCGVHLCFW